jgi:hypothetical protein
MRICKVALCATVLLLAACVSRPVIMPGSEPRFLDEKGPVFGYDKMIYQGRDEIRAIITSRLEKARNADPKTLSYDPASLRRFNRNSDDHIVILDDTTAKHTSTWQDRWQMADR